MTFMQDPAFSIVGSEDSTAVLGARRELETVLERARDERFRLVRIIKSYEAKLADAANPVPAETLARLHGKIDALDRAVDGRFDQLHEVEQAVDKRLTQLKELESAMAGSVASFSQVLDDSKQFGKTVALARQEVKSVAGQVAEDIRQKLTDLEAPLAAKLRQAEQIDHTVSDKIDSIGRTVEHHTSGLIASTVEQARLALAPLQSELEAQARMHVKAMDQVIGERIAGLDVDVDEALKPLTERFAAMLETARQQADELEARLTQEASNIVAASLAGQIDALVEDRLESIEPELEASLDRTVRQKVAAAMASHQEDMQAKVEGVQRRAAALQAQLESAADQQAEQLDAAAAAGRARRDELIAQTLHQTDEANRTLQALRDQVDQATQRVAAQRATLDAAVREADQAAATRSSKLMDEVGQHVQSAFDSRLTSLEAQFSERAISMEQAATRRCDQAVETLDNKAAHVRKEMREQVVTLMSKADDLMRPFTERIQARLADMERDADAGVARLESKLTLWGEAQSNAAVKAVTDAMAQAEQEVLSSAERMAQRADHLDAVRQRLAEMIDDERDAAEKSVEQAVAVVKQQLDQARRELDAARETVSGESSTITELMAGYAQRLEGFAEQAELQLQSRREQAVERIDEVTEQLREQAAAAVAGVEQSVEDELARLSDRHAQAADRSRQETGRLAASCESQIQRVDQHVEERFARMEAAQAEAGEAFADVMDKLIEASQAKVDALQADARAALEPMQQMIDTQLETFKNRMSTAMNTARREAQAAQAAVDQLVQPTADQRLQLEEDLQAARTATQEIQDQAAQAVVQLRESLDTAREQVRIQAGQALDEVLRVASDRVDALTREAQERTEPMTEAVAAQIEALEAQGRESVDAARKRLADHVAGLRASSEAMVTMLEQTIDRRIAGLKPRATRHFDDADHAIRHRLEQVARALDAVQVANPDDTQQAISDEGPDADVDVKTAQNLNASIYEMANKVVKSAQSNPAA